MLAPSGQKCPCCGQPVTPSRVLVDLTSNAFSIGGQMLHASPQQVDILDAIAVRAPRVITYDTLIYQVWGNGEPENAKKILEVGVCALRKLLVGSGVRIDTVHNRGYRLVAA